MRGLQFQRDASGQRPGGRRWTGESANRRLEVSGKRGISAPSVFAASVTIDEKYTQFEDRPSFEQVEQLANRFLDAYQAGALDRLDIAYTKFENMSRQHATVETLLPLGSLEGGQAEADSEVEYEFLPSARSILDEVVPTSFKVKLFKCFLDAAVSEQIARMVAMKAATENADTMIGNLTMTYNRARQGQITNELLEVIAAPRPSVNKKSVKTRNRKPGKDSEPWRPLRIRQRTRTTARSPRSSAPRSTWSSRSTACPPSTMRSRWRPSTRASS